MPVTLKAANVKYKSAITGEYVGVNSVSDNTTAEQIASIGAAGQQQINAVVAQGQATIASIPVDYTNLSNEVTDLKSATSAMPVTKKSETYDVDLDVTDEDGNVILRLSDGHIKTKNFDSESSDEVKKSDASGVDLDISDESGNVILRLQDGHIKTKNFNSLDTFNEIKGTKADGVDLDISDISGNVIARFEGGDFKTKNYSLKTFGGDISSLKDVVNFGLENRLANPLFTSREKYNEDNPSAQIDADEVLIYGHTGTTIDGYRIPAIAVSNAGTFLVAGTHMENALGDYGDFSIDFSRKSANGEWSEITTLVPFDTTRQDYGSVLNNEFLVDRNTGRIYLFYGTEKPDIIWWEVDTEDGDFRYIYSDDDGVTWSTPVSLKSIWDTDAYDYCIPSCTKGITLTNGTLVVPCFCKKGATASTAYSYPLLLIKPPSGSWYFSSLASVPGIKHLDECSVVEGTTANEIWLYARPNTNYGTGINRGYNKFIYDIGTNTFTHVGCTFDTNRHNCFCLDRITLNNTLVYLMTFTDTHDSDRKNITLWASLDGNIWIRVYRIHKEKSAGYSVIDNYNGRIGVAYESASNRSVIAFQDISDLATNISNTAAYYIVRNISVQDRMQMLFNKLNGID